ncbi:MAG: TolC family protein [candidate division KSB1 bacterium]|nr:TolC family protein [candidate division KSB1 bacterium]
MTVQRLIDTGRMVFLLSMLILAAPGMKGRAQSSSSEPKLASEPIFVHMMPYTEEEIEQVLQRPLKLEDCIRIAMRKNLQLLMEEYGLRMTVADLSGSYAPFLPQFSIDGNMQKAEENRPFEAQDPLNPTRLTYDKNAIIAKIQQGFITGATLTLSADLRRDINSPDRFGAPPTRTENKGYSIKLEQPLLRDAWFTIAKSPITLARQEMEIRENQFHDMKLRTVFDVKKAYYNVILQKELMKVTRAALERDSTLVRLSESKVRVNLATRRDVLSAQIRFAEDRASFIAAQTDYERALDDLKDVLGLPIEMEITLEDVQLGYSPEPLDEEFLIRHAIENNPLVRSLHKSIENLKLKHKVAKNMLLPRLDLVLQYNGQFDSDRDQLKTIESNDFQIGLSLSYPFLNRQAAAEAEKTQLALQQEVLRLRDYERQLKLSIREVVRSTYSNIEEIEALKISIEAAREKVEFATMMFNLGRASNLDVTDAQEALLKAQTQYLKKLIDYHLQLAFLETLIAQPIVF